LRQTGAEESDPVTAKLEQLIVVLDTLGLARIMHEGWRM
jgi:hypothetical protein